MKARYSTRRAALFLIILLLSAACEALPQDDGSERIEASGVVEAVQVSVASEVGGRVDEVFVAEGDSVAAGDPLLRLEDSVLEGQRRQAAAMLEAAQADAETARAALALASAQSTSANLSVDAAEAALATAEAGVQATEARLEAARAGVDDAELGFRMALADARRAVRSTRIEAWNQDLPSSFTTPPWFFRKDEALEAAESEVEAARIALDNERGSYAAMIDAPRFETYAEAAARLAEAQAAFLVVEELLAREVAPSESQEIEGYVQELYDAAESELEAAQMEYDQILSDEAMSDVLEARSRLAAAEERYDTARDRRDALLTGEDSLAVSAAEAAVHQADLQVIQAAAALEQAQAARTQAQIAVAQAEARVQQLQATLEQAQAGIVRAEKAVAQAQANLDLVELQIRKLVIRAAVAGTVMTRNAQPGEVIQPGMAALTLGNLDDLRVTVYIAENQYGRIALGDSAQVTVDAFPGQSFEATVTRIADEAEYTPRNVQTTEERQTTVYAVELTMAEGVGRLKPGMPADVVFP